SSTIAVLDRATSTDEAAGVGMDTSIAIASDGLPVVAFRDAGERALKIARCSDERCTQAVISTVVREPGLDPGHNTTLRLAPDGSPMLAYGDWSETDPGIYYAKCSNAEGQAVSVSRIDRAEDGESADPALELDKDGPPVIAFRQREPGDERASRVLRVVRCEDVECSSMGAPTDVDVRGRTGYSSNV